MIICHHNQWKHHVSPTLSSCSLVQMTNGHVRYHCGKWEHWKKVPTFMCRGHWSEPVESNISVLLSVSTSSVPEHFMCPFSW
jgi:hypothetical protein